MKGTIATGLAGALLLAGTLAIGTNACAATAAAAPAAHDAKSHCEMAGKKHNLKDAKLEAYVKKCEARAEAAQAKKAG